MAKAWWVKNSEVAAEDQKQAKISKIKGDVIFM
jgi:hypothetical protein